MKAALVLALTSLSGCAYEHTAGRRSASEMPETYQAYGWDSGLALNLATEKARARHWDDQEPDAVDMDCTMYGIKPAIVGAAWAIAGALIVNHHVGAGSWVGFLSLPAAFWPNCSARVGYLGHRDKGLQTPPVAKPPAATSPVDPPVRMLHQTAPGSPAQTPPTD